MTGSIYDALREVTDLMKRGPERDRLWLAIWRHSTTQHHAEVTPRGSTARVRVSSEHASAELIAAWEWLLANEGEARAMQPGQLHRTLRGVATRSHRGSARTAMSDALCGLTHVPAQIRVEVGGSDALELAAS
jgi:hypothetical protein